MQKLDTLLNPYADFAEEQKKCLPLSIKAKDVFSAWYIEHLTRTQQEESNVKYFLGKGQGYVVLRLALLLELLWWASLESAEPTEVSAEAVEAAINLYDSYLLPMCERVYYMYYSPAYNIEARALAHWIIKNKPKSFTLRDVYNNGTVKYLRRKEPTEKAAKRLVELNWLHYEDSRAGTTKGNKCAYFKKSF